MIIDKKTLIDLDVGKDDFIQTCFARFGSMNKNDYEVALFHLLQENGYSDKSDHFMSKLLQIPESKVKRLRYEVNLVYPKTDDEYKKEFYDLLNRQSYKITHNNKIQFAVNDKMLRLYLNDKLDEVGSFSDSSFNSNIVTISAMDLLVLLSDFEHEDDVIKHVKNEIKNNRMMLPRSFSEKTMDFLVATAKDIGSKVSRHITDYIIDSLQNKYVSIK